MTPLALAVWACLPYISSLREAAGAEAVTAWTLLEDFDSVRPSWQVQLPEKSPRLRTHRRTDLQPKNGLRCEQLVVRASRGQEKILASHPLPPSMAIDEFAVRLWVRGDNPGVQLMARVRLPRALDPRTGEPLSMLVSGQQYQTAGAWQLLVLDDLPRKISRRTRLLIVEFDRAIDPAEAYVDRIVLNLYGSAGVNQIWVDDLQVTGSVPRIVRPDKTMVRLVSHQANLETSTPRVVEQNILIDGKPLVPRVVAHHGEPLTFLQGLGFNCVWLDSPPTVGLNQQARQLNMWLISPAPRDHRDEHAYDRVVAWDVGRNLDAGQFEAVEATARSVRRQDPQSRPLIATVNKPHAAWLRVVNLPVELDEAQAPEPTRNCKWKAVTLAGLEGSQCWLDLRRTLHTQIAAGGQVCVVQTASDLRASLRERQWAELINLELSMFQPWFSDSTAVRPCWTSQPDTKICLLSNRRTEFALVTNSERPVMYPEKLLIPVQRAESAFLMEPGRMSPLASRSVPGGVSIDAPRGDAARILFTDESSTVESVSRHLRSIAPRYNHLTLAEARAELLSVDRLIAKAELGVQESDFRRRLYRLHQLLPESGSKTSGSVTCRQLEKVLLALQTLKRQVVDASQG